MEDEKFSTTLLHLLCEKNSDGTKTLRLKGRELEQRIGKRLDCSDMIIVSEFLLENPNVVGVNLSYNNIGDKGIYIFKTMYLKTENSLLHLHLSSCSLTWRSMEQLYFVVDNLKLKTLRLNGNKLGNEGGRFLAHLLENNNTITHLDIGNSDQTLSTVPYYMGLLRADIWNNTSIKILDISRIISSSQYYQYDSGHLAEQIGDMLKMNTTLQEAHFENCEFDGHDIERMLYGMSFNNTLIMLDLGNNRMGCHGIELLGKWLRTRPNLLGLNVCGNNIGDSGCRALSQHLPFSKIRFLDISRNRIGDLGIIHLLYTIKKSYRLRVLFIWGNKFTEKSLQIIRRMLKAEVLDEAHMDIKLYEVDGILHHAFVPVDHYKHRYYEVMDYGCAVELKIKRNIIEDEYTHPRNLTNFKFYDKIPAAEDSPRRPIC